MYETLNLIPSPSKDIYQPPKHSSLTEHCGRFIHWELILVYNHTRLLCFLPRTILMARSHNFSPTPIVLIPFRIQFLPPSNFIQSASLTEVENWSQPGVVGGLPDGLDRPEEVLGLVSVRVLLVDLKRVEVAILLGERILAGTCCHLVVEVIACITVAGLWSDHHHFLALKDRGKNTQYFRIRVVIKEMKWKWKECLFLLIFNWRFNFRWNC